jgi:hypothetical protein
VDDDLGVADAANAIEELKQVALRGIIGKVADVKTLGGHFGGVRWGEFAGGFRFTRWARRWTALLPLGFYHSGVGDRSFGVMFGFGWTFAKKAERDGIEELLKTGAVIKPRGALSEVFTARATVAAIAAATAAARAIAGVWIVRHGFSLLVGRVRVRAWGRQLTRTRVGQTANSRKLFSGPGAASPWADAASSRAGEYRPGKL